MNGFLRLLLTISLALTIGACASQPPDESGLESPTSTVGTSDGDFAETDSTAQVGQNSDQAIEDELNQSEGMTSSTAEEKPAAESQPVDEFAQFENEKPETAMPPQAQAEPPPAIEPPPPEVIPPAVDLGGEPSPVVENAVPEPVPVAVEAPQSPLVNIKNIKYKANDNGGTVVVEADGPLTFQTRSNPETNQFVIEIPGAKLPQKLKRPFNTKDMKGGIGSIDSYQNKGSSTARIVVQLRQGASEPVVQAEGNSLLIVEAGVSAAPPQAEVSGGAEVGAEANGSLAEESTTQSKILSSQSLEEFISENMQFYGKKVSLETSEMDVREVFKLLGEESGVNMVLSDEVRGTVSLKLRQVPWDQALVVIMKAKKLGYTRAGNVLRIAPMADIKAEEDETVRLANLKKSQAPLKVKMAPVSYAKIEDLVTQVKPFLSERGKVVGDSRTSALVISDIDENMDRILKLVSSIDVPPLQVLIEGKVIEASDQFQKQIGINWSTSGRPSIFGSNGDRDLRGTTRANISPGIGPTPSFGLNFNLGTLDILGDLTAQLGLFEKQDLIKVLSAPRIMTLHNESAEINQITEIPISQENVTSTGSTRTVSFKQVKLSLLVTPQITNDAAVIMAVGVNRDFLGAVAEEKTGVRPVNTRSAKTKVMVKNGQTAVIGGIFQSDDSQGETKVPWVGDIPILGWLFKSKDWKKNKNELLIFLTPRIIGQADSQSISSDGGAEL